MLDANGDSDSLIIEGCGDFIPQIGSAMAQLNEHFVTDDTELDAMNFSISRLSRGRVSLDRRIEVSVLSELGGSGDCRSEKCADDAERCSGSTVDSGIAENGEFPGHDEMVEKKTAIDHIFFRSSRNKTSVMASDVIGFIENTFGVSLKPDKWYMSLINNKKPTIRWD